ncbi:hypothetical protein E0L36_25165 [Streptomyces sp. AJS327]|uniref:AAA family ATPase n=1 Tax=Streptomyces sp. AJS327 TaxID=2545265 RepID=UPI0015DDE6AC|nr:AAA family ATPase [Streptomyces sp. AJS327]MBA0054020.1 hypothetical protein [Streptomyces sp. AJS327]
MILDPGALVVLIGPAGSGKSTFARRVPASWRVCLDDLREMVSGDAADQSATPVAVRVQGLVLEERLARGLTTLVDSTNLEGHVRRSLLARARYWQRTPLAVLFEAPVEVCLHRAARRQRQVPPEVIRAQHRRLPLPGDLRAEGFAEVHPMHLTDSEEVPT